MENAIRFHMEKIRDPDSLFLASLILFDVNRSVRDIQTIVAVVLRYAMIGGSVTNGLIGWIVSTATQEN